LLERPETGERALLVHIKARDPRLTADLYEFRELALSAGAIIVDSIVSHRDIPDPKYYLGSGKVAEIKQLVISLQIQLLLVNHELSPSQERNLEEELQCRVVDRTGLILDIFAQRARTFEGKLQVELAQLQHISTRLIRGWTHLERQKGGIGLRGPGETQLEEDRRVIRDNKVVEPESKHIYQLFRWWAIQTLVNLLYLRHSLKKTCILLINCLLLWIQP